MIIQLNPPIPMLTPKGKGLAWLVIDYSPEHHLMWTVAINETGELWTFPNSVVNAEKNITMGRMVGMKSEKDDKFDVIFDRMEVMENNFSGLDNSIKYGLDNLTKHVQEGIEKLYKKIEVLDKYVADLIEDVAIIENKMKELEIK